jgi:chemotaxis signal transduction protein
MENNRAATLPMLTPTQALTTGFAVDQRFVQQQTSRNRTDIESRQGFRIGDLHLMIRYEDGSELSEIPVIHRMPSAPDWFCGVANLHGKVVPVFDLARYIGVEPASDAKRMLLVLSRGADAAGVVIDGLPVRLRIETENFTDDMLVPLALEGLVKRSYWIEEHNLMDLNVEALLAQLEQNLIT